MAEIEEFAPPEYRSMSDDEGPDGDYGVEDFDPGMDDAEAEPDKEETDEEEEPEEADAEEAAEDDLDETVSLKAQPQRIRIDPVVRASNKPVTIRIVPDEERVTDNRLHKSEAALIIAKRAAQIATHAKHFARNAQGLHDPVAIAYQELYERRCPLKLHRRIRTDPNGDEVVESWSPRKMALPPLQLPRSYDKK